MSSIERRDTRTELAIDLVGIELLVWHSAEQLATRCRCQVGKLAAAREISVGVSVVGRLERSQRPIVG